MAVDTERYWKQDDEVTAYWRWQAMAPIGCPYSLEQAAQNPDAWFQPEPGLAYVSPANVVVTPFGMRPACHYRKDELRPLVNMDDLRFESQPDW